MASQVPLPVQTMYAELVERAHIGLLAKEFDPAGRFYKKTVKGRDYWYFRAPMKNGVRRDKYVGVDSENLRNRIEQHRSEKDSYKLRRTLVSGLIRTGIRGPDPRTGRLLEAFADAGIFRSRAVLIGTAAYQTYPALLGVKFANTNAMTDDLDLAQFNSVSIAVEDEVDIPLLDILRKVEPNFQPIPETFTRGRTSRFALGDKYRVDLLTPNRGPDSGALVALPALKTDAQPLRFLDFLIYQEVQAVVLYGMGVPVNVPAPERYALHKLIVSRLRIATAESQAKAAKDLRQAGELIAILAEQRPYELKDLWDELTERGPRWRQLTAEAVSLLDQATGSSRARQKLEALVGPAPRG